jgi:hypothetical protein
VAGWAVALMAAYLVLAFGVRVAVQLRRTGATGISSLGTIPTVTAASTPEACSASAGR